MPLAQGYLREDMVWESLASVDGDTAFLRGDFTPFVPKSTAKTTYAQVRAQLPPPNLLNVSVISWTIVLWLTSMSAAGRVLRA